MNCKLTRTDFGADGIFGSLSVPGFASPFATLEHAFPSDSGFLPATPSGTYQCIRGLHQLEGMSHNFLAFELQNVPGHSGILIHVGNSNADSSGCILIGLSRQGSFILSSRIAFGQFMEAMARTASFQLEIV